jgi:hypothetical protein
VDGGTVWLRPDTSWLVGVVAVLSLFLGVPVAGSTLVAAGLLDIERAGVTAPPTPTDRWVAGVVALVFGLVLLVSLLASVRHARRLARLGVDGDGLTLISGGVQSRLSWDEVVAVELSNDPAGWTLEVDPVGRDRVVVRIPGQAFGGPEFQQALAAFQPGG